MEINNMEILKGLPVANAINEKLMEQVKSIEGSLPHLAIIRVGERPDDCSYERGAVKKMDKVGVRCTTYTFDADIDNDTFQAEFDKINENPDIDGILMLRPLPKQLDEKQIENKIDPRKDLDGISPLNLAKVYAGDESGYAPCTAEAVIEMLDYAGIDIKGKRVTVVGRSLVIGKPVSMLLMKRNATVTVCHTKTVDMEGTCKNAEILVAAAGSARMIKKDYVAEGAIVVDVGINVDEEGNLCGDVDFDAITDIAAIATPVPGGVGSVTTSVLAKHLVKAAMAR
jgi:methylenetetrahydrofolate dehydrogenase (NADP+)/methenyltetrahydrofolate cyclohydrolase